MNKEKAHTSLRVNSATLNKLNRLKYLLGTKGVGEVIEMLLKVVSKFKLMDELKGVKKK